MEWPARSGLQVSSVILSVFIWHANNMAIEFRGVRFPPLRDLTVSAPSGAVIGIIGEKGAGKGALLRLAAGDVEPEAGEVVRPVESRYLGPSDALQLSP